MIRKIYSEDEKAKYVAGFKKCTLTLRDYAEKMQINHEDLRRWLKENTDSINFGKINVSDLVTKSTFTPSSKAANFSNSTLSKTVIKFECDTIKLELKENYDRAFLSNLLEVLVYAK